MFIKPHVPKAYGICLKEPVVRYNANVYKQ